MAMILTHPGGCANKGQDEKEQARDFQPENVQHTSDAAHGDAARLVKSPDPAILTGFATCDAQKRPALSTESAGWQL